MASKLVLYGFMDCNIGPLLKFVLGTDLPFGHQYNTNISHKMDFRYVIVVPPIIYHNFHTQTDFEGVPHLLREDRHVRVLSVAGWTNEHPSGM